MANVGHRYHENYTSKNVHNHFETLICSCSLNPLNTVKDFFEGKFKKMGLNPY